MTDDTYTFQLTDADGEPHDYEVQRPHRPIERANRWWGGVKLLQTVARAAGDPIARMLEANIGQLVEGFVSAEAQTVEGILDSEFGDIELNEFDFELPEAWDAFLEAVERVQSDELFMQLLHHTSRDGAPLAQEEHFNSAYERNYMEMLRAAFKVAQYNGFFGRLDTLIGGHNETT